MKRRNFINLTGAGLVYTGFGGIGIVGCKNEKFIFWKKESGNNLFSGVECEGTPLVQSKQNGLMNVKCNLVDYAGQNASIFLNPQQESGQVGTLKARLKHDVKDTFSCSKEDLLEATLFLKNEGNNSVELNVNFTTGAQPSGKSGLKQGASKIN